MFLVPPETDRYAEHGNKVMWLMHKAIYGLRQSPRIFQEFVAEALCEEGKALLLELLMDVLEAHHVTVPATSHGDMGPVVYHDLRGRKDPCGVRCLIGVGQGTRGHEWGYLDMPAPPADWQR